MNPFEFHARQIVSLLQKKNQEYGDDNLLKHGLLGIYIRLSDKLARLKYQLVHENVTEDTLMDIAGYAINALRLINEGRLSYFGELSELVKGRGLDE